MILRSEGHRVPKDGRTLLKTPRSVPVMDKCGGQYAYFGTESWIVAAIAKISEFYCTNNTVKLIVNVDGVPIHKSSSKEFWPIQCSIFRLQHPPFLVALYYGKGKPKPVGAFLSDLLEEYKHLVENGITSDGKVFHVTIKAFVCDAPARAYLKCIKGHTAFAACERCEIQERKKEGRTVLLAEGLCIARTDEKFANFYYDDHQQELSPLLECQLPRVTSFSLDYMHLVCLGVTRKMLSFAGKMPFEFARHPRSLSDLDRWKATELRQFLLYTGPIVLKKVVKPEVYEAFVILSVTATYSMRKN